MSALKTGSTCFLWHLHYHTDTLWMFFVSLSTRCYSSLRRHWARMELLLGMNLLSQRSLTKFVHRVGEEPARQLCSCCSLRLVWWVHLKNAALKHTGGQFFNHGKSKHHNCISCNGSRDCSLSWIGFLKKHILWLALSITIFYHENWWLCPTTRDELKLNDWWMQVSPWGKINPFIVLYCIYWAVQCYMGDLRGHITSFYERQREDTG